MGFIRRSSADSYNGDAVTLQKISSMEDEYSKMKSALLHELDIEESLDLSDEKMNENIGGGAAEQGGPPIGARTKAPPAKSEPVDKIIPAAAGSGSAVESPILLGPGSSSGPGSPLLSSKINSRSFLDDSNDEKDFTKTHGKSSTLDEFVSLEPHKLLYGPSALKHDAEERLGLGDYAVARRPTELERSGNSKRDCLQGETDTSLGAFLLLGEA